MAQLPLPSKPDSVITRWKSILDPVIASPFVDAVFLSGIALINGATAIPHRLGRVPSGWILSDVTGSATIYRSQPFNSLTLTLNSSAAVSVNLVVF